MSHIDNITNMMADEEEAKIDLTPMLDVVFIMLIFFIVTATFVNEMALDANKPPEQDVVDTNSESITVVITGADKITIDGLNVDVRAVAAQIIRRKAENPKASVAVLAHRKSRADTLVGVVNAIKEAGVPGSIPINQLN